MFAGIPSNLFLLIFFLTDDANEEEAQLSEERGE